MSTMVMQREPSSPEFVVMQRDFGFDAGAEPLATMQSLIVPPKHALLPAHADAETFRVSLNPDLPSQRDTKHQIYFADLSVGDADPIQVALKTYKKKWDRVNDPEIWRREIAAHEFAKRSGLETLSPQIIANYGRVVLMGTLFVPGMYDLEQRYRQLSPEGTWVDAQTMLAASASALGALHNADVINGDAAPRNNAFKDDVDERGNPILTSVLIDPETYIFPGELDKDELKAAKKADVEYLVDESVKVIAAVESRTARGQFDTEAAYEARELAEDVIRPIYSGTVNHNMHRV